MLKRGLAQRTMNVCLSYPPIILPNGCLLDVDSSSPSSITNNALHFVCLDRRTPPCLEQNKRNKPLAETEKLFCLARVLLRSFGVAATARRRQLWLQARLEYRGTTPGFNKNEIQRNSNRCSRNFSRNRVDRSSNGSQRRKQRKERSEARLFDTPLTDTRRQRTPPPSSSGAAAPPPTATATTTLVLLTPAETVVRRPRCNVQQSMPAPTPRPPPQSSSLRETECPNATRRPKGIRCQ